MSEFEEQLLGKQQIKTQFQITEQRIGSLIEEIKQINDQQQTFNGSNMTYQDINQQKNTFKIKAEKLKTELNTLDRQAKGEQRGIAAKLKSAYAREIERQKRIMRSFINSSFEQKFNRISVIKASKAYGGDTQQEQLKYFVDQNLVKIVPKDQRESFLNHTNSLQNQVQPAEMQRVKAVSIDQDVIEQDMIDLENMLIDERQRELDQIEQEAMNLNLIAGQMGQLVDEQGKDLDHTQNQMDKTKTQMISIMGDVEQANNNQRKNRKFLYMGIAIVLLILVAITLVIVVIVK